MLLVKTKIGMSDLHGIGLFADQFIAKGTSTWQYNPLFDPSYTEEEVMSLPQIPRDTILHHAYFDSSLGKLVMPGDNLRFINHSNKNFNIISKPSEDVAARDIEAGEELLCDYQTFEPGYFERRGLDSRDFD